MSVLVTGARGFIGRHLVEALESEEKVVPFEGDIRDEGAWTKTPSAEVVYHLAAQSNVPASVQDPTRTWSINVDGTLRLLEWARRVEPSRIVLVSTAHVYGPAKYSPIDEEHPTHPISPYGASKLAAEAAARAYQASYGLDVVIVRPFNVYGPGQSRGFLIPDILHQVLEGRELVLGDPRPVRDFTSVSDAVSLLRLAGTTQEVTGEVFNLGSGKGHSVGEVVETALRVSGSDLKPVYDERRFRAGDTRELVVDNTRARRRLGWKPHASLEEGLLRTWEALAADPVHAGGLENA